MGLIRVTSFFDGKPRTTYMSSQSSFRSLILWTFKKNNVNSDLAHLYEAFSYNLEKEEESFQIPRSMKLKQYLEYLEKNSSVHRNHQPSTPTKFNSIAIVVRAKEDNDDMKLMKITSGSKSRPKMMTRIGDFFSITKSTRLDRTPSSKTFRKLFGSPLKINHVPRIPRFNGYQRGRTKLCLRDPGAAQNFLPIEEMSDASTPEECLGDCTCIKMPCCGERSVLVPSHLERLKHFCPLSRSFPTKQMSTFCSPHHHHHRHPADIIDGNISKPRMNITSTPVQARCQKQARYEETIDESSNVGGKNCAHLNLRVRLSPNMLKARQACLRDNSSYNLNEALHNDSEQDDATAGNCSKMNSSFTNGVIIQMTPNEGRMDSEVSSVWGSPSPTRNSVSRLSPLYYISDDESDSVFQVTDVSHEMETIARDTLLLPTSRSEPSATELSLHEPGRNRFFNDLIL